MENITIEQWQERLAQATVGSGDYWTCRLAIGNLREEALIAAGKYKPIYGVYEIGPVGSTCSADMGQPVARLIR